VDYREGRAIELLSRLSERADITVETLDIGDYLSGGVIIERKSDDFLDFKRVKTQIHLIKEKYGENSYLIVDRNLDTLIEASRFHYKKDMKNQILGFVASLSVRYKAVPLFCSNSEYTSYIIARICEKANDNKKANVYHSKPREKKMDKQIHLLCGLPNIDEKIAIRLLESFKTVRGVFQATEEELLEIDGIGKKKAKTILELIS